MEGIMKTTLKKQLRLSVIMTGCLACVILFAVTGCNPVEPLPQYYTVTFAGEGIVIES